MKSSSKSGKKNSIILAPVQIEAPRLSSKTAMSPALAQAMMHVKDFMTDPQKAMILSREGKIYLENGDAKGAIDCFSEGISLNPSVSLFSSRATAYKALDMNTEAYFDYSYNIRLEPETGVHFYNRGLCLVKLQKFSMAIEDLDIAIQYDPSPTHYYGRACAYAEFGKHELAISDFSAALVDEQNISTELKQKCRYKRALSHFEIKCYDDVVRDMQFMLAYDANNIPVRSLLGRALKITNDHKKAEEHLSHAIMLDEGQAALYVERGDIRFRTGQKNKIVDAIYDFDKAIKILEQKLAVRFGSAIVNTDFTTTSSTKITRVMARSNSLLTTTDKPPATATEADTSTSDVGVLHSAHSMHPMRSSSMTDLQLPLIHNNNNNNNNSGGGGGTGGAGPSSLGGLPTPIGSGGGGGGFSQQQPSSSQLATSTAANPAGSIHATAAGAGAAAIGGLVAGRGAAYWSELDDALADALFRRAQAKLLCDGSLPNIENALSDALRAISYNQEDDDYQMAAATCYIRLNRFDEAIAVLQAVLQRSPNNYKALYNYSFCQRATGEQKEAIEGLTKIISFGIPNTLSMTSETMAFPIHRAFEMRGTLFHELQAHKLALSDLGKAIAINSSRAENYFLRADCLCKMGNYEQALGDYNLAEQKGFPDMCALLAARGGVHRLLGNSQSAYRDFCLAEESLDAQDMFGHIRISSFKAFSLIDQFHYDLALGSLVMAANIASQLIREKLDFFKTNYDTIDVAIQQHVTAGGLETSKKPLSQLESDILYLKRVEWILCYHIALCYYMEKHFVEALPMLDFCLSAAVKKYVSDDLAYGVLYFFRAMVRSQLEMYSQAATDLEQCNHTHFVNSTHRKFLLRFAVAKVYQCQRMHREAIREYSAALDFQPDDPYCHFRRAWSYKAVGNYHDAGDDFETAKRLMPDDPNFAVDYKRISHCDFMVITTEPDLIERFPPLLPVPGFAAK